MSSIIALLTLFKLHRSVAVWRKGCFPPAPNIVGLFPLNNSYDGTWMERAALRQFTSQLIGRYIGGTALETKGEECILKIDDHLLREVAMLKELTWVYVIEAPSLVSQQFGQRHGIKQLFNIYMDAAQSNRQNLFPAFYRDAIEEANGDAKEVKRTVIDLIAGMTENQAVAMYTRLTGVSVGSGLDEILR